MNITLKMGAISLLLLSSIVSIVIVFSPTNDQDQRLSGANESSTNTLSDYSDAIADYLLAGDFRGSRDVRGQDSAEVSIGDFFFQSTELIVSPGTTVSWTNTGNVRHNVVSWSDSPGQGLDSELLANGESYSTTFEDEGDYVYYCSPHPFTMRGVVSVRE